MKNASNERDICSLSAVGHAQSGAVLVVSLIMLVVMTLLVISMIKTSVIELKIGGVSQTFAINIANAELAINKFISDNNGRFAPGFLANACTSVPGQGGPCYSPPPTQTFYGYVQNPNYVTATQLMCGAWFNYGTQYSGASSQQSTTLDEVQFDISTTAEDQITASSTTLHTGIYTLAAQGC